MDAIVLAGGFAKRMWPLTKDTPKHLLKVNGKPMLGYVIQSMEELENLERVIISTNAKFADQFEEFCASYEDPLDLKLVIEDSFSEGEKLGSIGAMAYIVENMDITGELLIIGGDNLLSLSLKEMYDFYSSNGDSIAVHDLGSKERASLYGIVDFADDKVISQFIEKPEDPPTAYAATACYMLSPPSVADICEYVKLGLNTDAMGFFISWLYKQRPVFAYPFSGYWFDIGSIQGLEEADVYFTEHGM